MWLSVGVPGIGRWRPVLLQMYIRGGIGVIWRLSKWRENPVIGHGRLQRGLFGDKKPGWGVQTRKFGLKLTAVNRTNVELKYLLYKPFLGSLPTVNRTNVELKSNI